VGYLLENTSVFVSLMFCCKRKKWRVCSIACEAHYKVYIISGRRGSRHKQALDDVTKTRGYWKLKAEALDLSLWRTRFRKGYGSVVRQATELINYGLNWCI
jgi:hypothetical protein